MSIKINLAKRKTEGRGLQGNFYNIAVGLFVLFVVYFLGKSGYLIYKMISVSNQQKKVDAENLRLSGLINSQKEDAARYVMIKGILMKIQELEKNKFNYKVYVDEVVNNLPSSVLVKNIDFSKKGWVAVEVLAENFAAVETFEEYSKKMSSNQNFFDGLYTESVLRNKQGNYSIKMLFSIKNKNVK